MRLVAQQQEQLRRRRERTSERLEAAERELQELHWWNRDRRGELATEIALDKRALEHANERSEELTRIAERRSRLLALARDRDDRTPSRRPEPRAPRLEREPPGLGLEL